MSGGVGKIRGQILKSSRLYGLSLNSDALKYLVEIMASLPAAEIKKAAEQIWSTLAKQKLTSGQITKDICEKAVLECTGKGTAGQTSLFAIIDAYQVPRLVYCKDRQRFIRKESKIYQNTSSEKTEFYRSRFHAIYQRLQRNPLFTPKSAGALDETTKFVLKPIEALYGSNILLENITVFGMITQLKPGEWYLEDLNGSVKLDISNAQFRPGLICDNIFVLCDGSYEDEVLTVTGISLPPCEEAKATRAQFGDMNFFGGELPTCASSNVSLKAREQENADAFLVFISSVHLDDPEVMKRLSILFHGYSMQPPVAFIFCGPYLTSVVRPDPAETLTECFKILGKMIAQHPKLKEQTRFIFVPAMDDIGGLAVYPRPPIPPSVTAVLRKQVKLAEFTTNPTRIQYCTKEIVIMREDLLPKMFRCRVNSPKDDLPNQFARTLVSQASLCLLPLNVMPVYWTQEHSMSLYPLPNLVITADTYFPFTETIAGCSVVNPGSFPGSKFCFKVYYPITGETEDCELPSS